LSQSRSGKWDPDLEGMELCFHQKGGSSSFGAKWGCLWMEWIRVIWTQLLDPLVEQSAQISNIIFILFTFSVKPQKVSSEPVW